MTVRTRRVRVALAVLAVAIVVTLAAASWCRTSSHQPPAVDVGGLHSCQVESDGSVACWGADDYGQATPPPGTFLSVSAGDLHTCGVRTDGSVACWGLDLRGQASPPDGTFLAVAAGDRHSCGLRPDGSVQCWGGHHPADYGPDSTLTTPPEGEFVAIDAGARHTCAVTAGSLLRCWGWNNFGRLPPPVGSYAAVSTGSWHTCAVRTDGSVECWGWNAHGQATPPGGEFASVAAGWDHSCGVRTDGSVACWGADEHGQAAPPVGEFASVSAGTRHSCGARTDGSVACWGREQARAEAPAGSYASVGAGKRHACAVRTDGSVACWGSNDFGQATPPVGEFTSVSGGYGHSCGVSPEGTVRCWGINWSGQATPPEGEFASISAGGTRSCAVRSDGSAACWGSDDYGYLAPQPGEFVSVSVGRWDVCGVKTDGSVACWGSDSAYRFPPPEGTFAAVAVGLRHYCALAGDGSIACWGEAWPVDYGQNMPPQGRYVSLSAGSDHACALERGGSVSCWGADDYGQATPPDGTFVSVSAGGEHTCGVQADGSVVCWGRPFYDDRPWPAAWTQEATATPAAPPPALPREPGDEALAACANGVAVPFPNGNPGLVRDCAVLLEARDALLGSGAEADWTAERPVAEWSGVRISGSPPRVTELGSSAPTSGGRLPPVLGQLSHLQYLGLYNSDLTGEIPPELGLLTDLRLLELFGNELSGEIPPELGQLSNLGGLWLSSNQLTGPIPPELGQLSALWDLLLGGNRLLGTIPPELGQLSNLRRLHLGENRVMGEIPPELGQLFQLKELDLSVRGERFTGAFPRALGQLSKLTSLSLRTDRMTGCIPPSLQRFAGSWELPFCRDGADAPVQPPDPGLVSACATGAVPDPEDHPALVDDCAILLEAAGTLASRRDLLDWSADRPISSWSGVTVEGSPRRVTVLRLRSEDLDGEIPAGISRLSHLHVLGLGGNQLTGEIPPELGQLSHLRSLSLSGNQLGGEIPAELAELSFLEQLSLDDNELTGDIPPEIGSISTLENVSLSGNRLTGTIPLTLAGLSRLQGLELAGNRLTGGIPKQLFSTSRLAYLDLRDNLLTGEIPREFAGFRQSRGLWLSGNPLTGCLPLDTGQVIADSAELGLRFCTTPRFVMLGDVPPEAEAAVRAGLEAMEAFFAERFDAGAADYTVYVAADWASAEGRYRDIFSREGPPSSCLNDALATVLFVILPCEESLSNVGWFHFQNVQRQIAPRANPYRPEYDGVHPQGADWLHFGAQSYAHYAYLSSAQPEMARQLRSVLISSASHTGESLREIESQARTHSVSTELSAWEARGFLAAEWLAEHAGEPALLDYYRVIASSRGWRHAFERAFGLGLERFYEIVEPYINEIAPPIPHLADDRNEPVLVLLGDIAPEAAAAVRADFEGAQRFFSERLGVDGADYTVYVAADDESAAPAFRKVLAADPYAGFCFTGLGNLALVMTLDCGRPLARYLGRFHYTDVQSSIRAEASFADRSPIWLRYGFGEYARYAFLAEAGPETLDQIRSRLAGVARRVASPLPAFERTYTATPVELIQPLFYFAVERLVERAGEKAIFEYQRRLSPSESWQETFEAVFDIAVEDFYEAFEADRADIAWPLPHVADDSLEPARGAFAPG